MKINSFKRNALLLGIACVAWLILHLITTAIEPKVIIQGQFAKENHIQLFYDTGNGFIESDSQKMSTDGRQNKLVMKLPVKGMGTFRLDLGNNPEEIVLKKITIQGGLKHVELVGEEITKAFDVRNQINAVIPTEEGLIIKTTMTDPYLYSSTGELGINAGNMLYKLIFGAMVFSKNVFCYLALILALITVSLLIKPVKLFKKQVIIVGAIFIGLLTMSMSFNVFNIGDEVEFDYAKNDNHGTFGTILGIRYEGFKYWGLESRYDTTHGELEAYDVHSVQSDYYFDDIELTAEDLREVYLSRSNIRGLFYGIIDIPLRFIGIPPNILFNLYIIGSNLAFALGLIVIMRWIYYEFGKLATLLCGLSVLGAEYLVVAGASLDNAMISLILPLVVTIHILYKEKHLNIQIKGKNEFWLVFVTVLLKALEGYEFMPSVMVALTAPYFYYWVKEKQAFNQFIKRFVNVSIAAITAVISALSVHFIQLTFYDSVAGAKQALLHAFFKRTYGSNTFQLQEAEALAPSLESSVLQNTLDYLNMHLVFGITTLNIIIFICVVCIAIAAGIIYKKRKQDICILSSNVVLLIVSFLAMFSTLLIFKGHSFVHRHQTARVWFVPFIPMSTASIGILINQLQGYLNKNKGN